MNVFSFFLFHYSSSRVYLIKRKQKKKKFSLIKNLKNQSRATNYLDLFAVLNASSFGQFKHTYIRLPIFLLISVG